METLKVEGVDCKNCAAQVRRALEGARGVKEIEINLDQKMALVTFDPSQVGRQELVGRVEDAGFDVE